MIRTLTCTLLTLCLSLGAARPVPAEDPSKAVKETTVPGPDGVALKVRMEGPYTADVPLQVVCYFKYSKDAVKKMQGAPVELDKRLGGVIGSLRERGEFVGDELETVLVDAPKGTIAAKRLLLIGLGDEKGLTLELMERVGKTGLREAAKLGTAKVAFAPLIRDQGNTAIATGDVETAVTRGALLAYDTERRLQKQGFAKAYALEEWWVEAGPAYYDETVAGVKKAVGQAADAAKARDAAPYSSKSK